MYVSSFSFNVVVERSQPDLLKKELDDDLFRYRSYFFCMQKGLETHGAS